MISPIVRPSANGHGKRDARVRASILERQERRDYAETRRMLADLAGYRAPSIRDLVR